MSTPMGWKAGSNWRKTFHMITISWALTIKNRSDFVLLMSLSRSIPWNVNVNGHMIWVLPVSALQEWPRLAFQKYPPRHLHSASPPALVTHWALVPHASVAQVIAVVIEAVVKTWSKFVVIEALLLVVPKVVGTTAFVIVVPKIFVAPLMIVAPSGLFVIVLMVVMCKVVLVAVLVVVAGRVLLVAALVAVVGRVVLVAAWVVVVGRVLIVAALVVVVGRVVLVTA